MKQPTAATLAKYGISLDEWVLLLDAQGGVCAVCKKAPPSGRLNIDHDHVKGWKKLPAQERKLHVRGLLCWTDNLYLLGRGVSVARLENALAYLKSHAKRTR